MSTSWMNTDLDFVIVPASSGTNIADGDQDEAETVYRFTPDDEPLPVSSGVVPVSRPVLAVPWRQPEPRPLAAPGERPERQLEL